MSILGRNDVILFHGATVESFVVFGAQFYFGIIHLLIVFNVRVKKCIVCGNSGRFVAYNRISFSEKKFLMDEIYDSKIEI